MTSSDWFRVDQATKVDWHGSIAEDPDAAGMRFAI
jgi:hypothetical protein